MHDPVNDAFPVTIRGGDTRPDVPNDQWVDQSFAINTTTPFNHDLKPWSSSAPENAYRFRPHDDFDKVGRRMVEQLRRHERGTASFKDAHLSKMKGDRRPTAPSKCALMDRALQQHHRGIAHVSAEAEQRDAGRLEQPPAAASLPVEAFPFKWNSEDWYEYEVAQIRMKRFEIENQGTGSPAASEVTYKLLIGSDWDHHLNHLADDMTAFIRDVARGIIEEKLAAVRSSMSSYEVGGAAVDRELREAFNHGDNDYDDDEIAAFALRELQGLEAECVRTLGLINSSRNDFVDSSDANQCWPVVETMEPWRKMVEFWMSRNTVTLTSIERSTRKYEFRKYFRTIKIKMPFQSSEFERRMYDMRHWLHRRCSVEFQTLHKKNLVHDAGRFPVEHDPATKPTVHDHSMFSFALDWQQSPADFARILTAKEGDTFESIASGAGCTTAALRQSNPSLRSIKAGAEVVLPRSASVRHLATPRTEPMMVQLTDEMRTWEAAASAIGVTVEELQTANPVALKTYKDGFTVGQLKAPFDLTGPTDAEFATEERTFMNDSFESVAQRLGTTVPALKAANPSVTSPSDVETVSVPQSATRKRRHQHSLHRSDAETAELFPSLVGDRDIREIPQEFPTAPERANEFPDEFDVTVPYPRQPKETLAVDSWLATLLRTGIDLKR